VGPDQPGQRSGRRRARRQHPFGVPLQRGQVRWYPTHRATPRPR
jgi:hypothetical protein